MRALKNIANSWNTSVTCNTKITFNEYPSIVDKYKSGLTLQSIGDEYGVSRERIRQILSLYDISRVDGGYSTQSFMKCQDKAEIKRNKQEAQEQKCFQMYGCGLEFFRFMRGEGKYISSPLNRYRTQRSCASFRGVTWELTLHQWWDIWQQSGHWNERGLGTGKYVMARLCDIGAYSIDNVAIITHNENSREARDMDKVYSRLNTSSFKGKKHYLNGTPYTVKELADLFNIKPNTIQGRLSRGHSVIDSCTTPVKKWNR